MAAHRVSQSGRGGSRAFVRGGGRARCEGLEPRRLLAIFNGTAGADLIELTIVNRNQQIVASATINGVFAGTAPPAFTVIDIAAGEGNDTIIVKQDTHYPSIPEEVGVIVYGQGGVDSLIVDDTLNDRISSYTFNDFRMDYAFDFPYGDGFVSFNDSLENFTLDGARSPGINIFSKPAALKLNVTGTAGDDLFRVGGLPSSFDGDPGDIDSDGLDNITLNGGLGDDRIVFDDSKDEYNMLESENLVLDPFTLTKGGAQIVYGGFERQEVWVADVDGRSIVDATVSINGLSGQIVETRIFGGFSRGSTVNLGNGNLNNLSGTIDLLLRGNGALTLNDQSLTQGYSYVVDAATITRTTSGATPMVIEYDGAVQMQIHAGSGNDGFYFRQLPAGTSAIAYGNIGNDFTDVGRSGYAFDVDGNVTFHGGAGTSDQFRYTNYRDTATEPISATLSASTYAITGGLTHGFSGVELVGIWPGNGDTDLRVNNTASPANVSLGIGNDTVTIGNGDLDSNVAADIGQTNALSVSGNAGLDTLILDDSLDQNAGGASPVDAYQFDVLDLGDEEPDLYPRFRKTSDAAVRTLFYRDIEATTLEANAFANTIDVHNVITPVTIRANGGNDRVNVGDAPQLPAGALVSIDTGPEQSSAAAPFGDEVIINSDVAAGDAPAVVQLTANDSIERLTVNTGGTLRIPTGTTAHITGLLQLPGTIDLAGGMLVTNAAAAPSAVRSWLLNGFAGGAWNGTSPAGAIHSQAADAVHGLGYGSTGASGEPSPLAITSLGGFSIGPDMTVLRYTFGGDADLDGKVNIDDYGRIDSHVGTPGAIRWVEGNFNYDGTINIDDYGIIDSNITQQAGASAQAADPVAAEDPLQAPRVHAGANPWRGVAIAPRELDERLLEDERGTLVDDIVQGL